MPDSLSAIWNTAKAPATGPLHLAVGIFDGVHLGHRAVIDSALVASRQDGGLAGVFTFTPHPSEFLRPDKATRLLMHAGEKNTQLFRLGVDVVFWQQFDAAMAAVPADGFVSWLRQRLPELVSIHVGANFRFGQHRCGDIHTLVASGKAQGIQVYSVDRLHLNGEPISSSRIREALTAGDLATVNTLLGYRYSTSGAVVPGKKLGRTIGFPTLNMDCPLALQPPFGVYHVLVQGCSARDVQAVANYGLRPSVETTTKPQLEIHVLAQHCPFSEGDVLEVEWLKFIRPEQKFPSIDALRAQIAADCQSVLQSVTPYAN